MLFREEYSNGQQTKQKIVVFASNFQLEIAKKGSGVFLGDGTFQYVPAKFKQMYSLHTMVDGTVFPVAFALMEEKTAEAYEMLFRG